MISSGNSCITRPVIVDPAVSTFARWIMEQKRQTSSGRLYVVGVTGSIGRGKSTFCQSLIPVLDQMLTPAEGRTLTRSLDDYYLPKALRATSDFLARGYNPPGISNRGPAGTHDLEVLRTEMETFEKSSSSSVLQLITFDKQSDDRVPEPVRMQGKVGVLLFEGWFVGASTNVEARKIPPSLKRSVALALPGYKPFFDRLDALWAFRPVPLEMIIKNRIEEQQTLDKQSGRGGMTPEEIRLFARYFYEDSWEPGLDSPVPPDKNVSFWADVDDFHRFISVERGGRP
jgi:pantothenate kinase-related protein Tda10